MTEYKGYLINQAEFGSFKEINYNGRGSVDKSLRGQYTTLQQAQLAIDSFLRNKGTKDGERTSTS